MLVSDTKIRIQEIEEIHGEHLSLAEAMQAIQKTLPDIHEENPFNEAKNAIKSLREAIEDHFNDEETKVFPLGLMLGDIKKKKLIRELQKEHIDILGEFDNINEVIANPVFNVRNEPLRNEFANLARYVSDKAILHAQKEDTYLYPFLIKSKT